MLLRTFAALNCIKFNSHKKEKEEGNKEPLNGHVNG